MPEFILDHGTIDATRAFNDLDEFTQGYVEAMFFTETGYPENEDLEHASLAELAPETLDQIKSDCQSFQDNAPNLLSVAYDKYDYEPHQAGIDFWLTRNGHGAGFWDRGLEDVGELLSAAAKIYHESTLYRGDDGQPYIM